MADKTPSAVQDTLDKLGKAEDYHSQFMTRFYRSERAYRGIINRTNDGRSGFDASRWQTPLPADPDGDIVVETTPEEWATFLMATQAARRKLSKKLSVAGTPAAVSEFFSIFGLPTTTARRPPDRILE